MRLKAILFQRCSYCLQGSAYTSLWRMNPTCPNCGVKFEREPGYWMTAIFYGYLLGGILTIITCIPLILNKVPLIWYAIAPTIVLLITSPLIYRYARILWMHTDELLDPRDTTNHIPK